MAAVETNVNVHGAEAPAEVPFHTPEQIQQARSRKSDVALEHAKATLDPEFDNYDFPLQLDELGPLDQRSYLGYLTDWEVRELKTLRHELKELNYTRRLDTLTLLRFLRARGFKVAEAKEMFIKSENWRKEKDADRLPRTFVYHKKEEIFEYYPQYYHKTDKDGRPLYIEELGKIDLTKMNAIIGGNEAYASEVMQNNLIVEYEKLADPRLPACSRKQGRLIETCCTIMDAKGVSYYVPPPSIIAFVRSAMSLSSDNYPERLGKLYVINTGWVITAAWNMVKGFLDPVTRAKIKVGCTIEDLKAQIPEENLPEYLGGTCRCEGKMGCRGSDAGPWNDPEFRTTPWWEKPEETSEAATNAKP